MAQTQPPRDDAPVTASKTTDPARTLLAEVVTINAPRDQLYRFWRDTENLVGVMEGVISIEPLARDRSRWTVKGPAGRDVVWESVITQDLTDESISWQSAPGADVENSGRIEFRDAGERGTVVRATIAYAPPAGKLGEWVAKLFQREPRIQARRDLYRFKQLIEAGEIATGARNRRLHIERDGEQAS